MSMSEKDSEKDTPSPGDIEAFESFRDIMKALNKTQAKSKQIFETLNKDPAKSKQIFDDREEFNSIILSLIKSFEHRISELEDLKQKKLELLVST
jgi:uncharacterized protein YdcH (DUF465 family)